MCANIGNAVTVHFNTLPLNNSATITSDRAGQRHVGAGRRDRQHARSCKRRRAIPTRPTTRRRTRVTVVAPEPAGDTDADGLPNGWEAAVRARPDDRRRRRRPGQRRPHQPAGVPAGHAPARVRHHLLRRRRDRRLLRHADRPRQSDATRRALVLTRFQKDDGAVVRHLPGGRRRTAARRSRSTQVAGMASTAFSTLIEADVPVVADRTMSWDGTRLRRARRARHADARGLDLVSRRGRDARQLRSVLPDSEPGRRRARRWK